VSIPQNTVRARIAGALRRAAFLNIFAMCIAGVVALLLPTDYAWIVLIGTAVVAFTTTFFIARLMSRSILSEFYHALDAIIEFASGKKDTRVRSAGVRDVRQLADAFNKVAAENERALKALSGEDARQTRFVSDVSHEIRTPLTTISGNAELMLVSEDMPREVQERFLTTIVNEAGRLGRLAHDLVTLQRIEGATGELKLRHFNPRESAELAEQALEAIFELHNVSFFIKGEAPDVLGDRDRIQQVIVNLVDNATRVVGEQGKVWVELSTASRNDIDQKLVKAHALEVDTYALIAVCDNGPGIPEEEIPRIFERLYRTDESRARNSGGAGLGLSIVRAIIERHGGVIEVQRRFAGGMQFSIYLPVPPEFDTSEVGTKWAGWGD